MAHSTKNCLAAVVLALVSVPGIAVTKSAAPVQLVVLGSTQDDVACSVANVAQQAGIAAAPLGSFSLPQAVQCGASGSRSLFPSLGAALSTVHAYRDGAPHFAIPSSTASGGMLLNFDATQRSSSPRLTVSVPELAPGEHVAAVLEWNTPNSRLDLCLVGADDAAAACTGANAVGADPARVLVIGNPASATANSRAQSIRLQVALVAGSPPGELRLALEDLSVRAAIDAPVDHGARRPQDRQSGTVDVMLDLNPTTINVGQSAMLSWTSTNAVSCTASGAWMGDEPLSGNMTVTPASTGSFNYTLTCDNGDGTSQAMETQVLTVLSSGAGGGGGLDLLLLTLLAAAGLARMVLTRVSRPRRSPGAS
jgi:hypothetical protein